MVLCTCAVQCFHQHVYVEACTTGTPHRLAYGCIICAHCCSSTRTFKPRRQMDLHIPCIRQGEGAACRVCCANRLPDCCPAGHNLEVDNHPVTGEIVHSEGECGVAGLSFHGGQLSKGAVAGPLSHGNQTTGRNQGEVCIACIATVAHTQGTLQHTWLRHK